MARGPGTDRAPGDGVASRGAEPRPRGEPADGSIPWRALVESNTDPLALVAADGTILYVTDSIREVLGYGVDEYRGRNLLDFVHPDDMGRARGALSEVLSRPSRRVVAVVRSRHKDGSWVDIESAAVNRLGDPDVRAVLLNLRDVTERRHSEEALRVGSERLHLHEKALEAAANAVVITDPDGRITWVNPAFTTLTGFSSEEVLGSTPRILRSGTHDDAFYRDLWATVLAGRVWRGEIVNRRKDGTSYAEEMTITPVVDRSGATTHFVAIKSDVSERKALEEQLRQAQKMEAVGRLAGGVAHDFNNLLTAILGYGGMLLSTTADADPKRRKVEQIVRAAERGASLTHQLLAFSRKQVLQPSVIDLNRVVADVEAMLRRMIGEDVELVTLLAAEIGCVRADEGQLVQVLMNLAVNARDAMPRGGRLTIETATVGGAASPGREPGEPASDGWVVLSVSDTGSGMDERVLSHLFEPFFTTKEAGKGTGLGLATVYGIVKQSGGRIDVRSEPGKGACFRIHLPRLVGVDCRPVVPDAPPGSVRGTETLLLIEDEEEVRKLVRETLEDEGYAILEAPSGAAALDLVARHTGPLHLMLSDIVMPGMSGVDVAARIRASRPTARVLFMSGYADEALVGRAAIGAGSTLLTKPFLPSVLLRRVRDVLDAKPDAAEART